jgi:hypothetical protein
VNPAALFEQHKKTLAIGGAALVGGLALMQARKRGSAPASPAPATAPGYGSPVSYAAPDTSASDLYSTLQPQVEYLQRLYEREQEKAAIPVPAAGIYAGGANIYESFGDGTVDALTAEEYLAKGAPPVQQLAKDDPWWQRVKLVGDGALGYRPIPAGANLPRLP